MSKSSTMTEELTIAGQATQATETLKATAGTDSALEAMAKKLAILKGEILGIQVVNTDGEAAALGANGRKAVEMKAMLEKDRTALTVPLNAVLKVINGKWGALTEPLDAMAKHARTLIGEHDERKLAAAEKARWRAQFALDLEASADLSGAVGSTIATLETIAKTGTLDEWEARMLERARQRKREITNAQRKHERAVDKAEEKGKEAPPPPATPAPATTAIAPQVSRHVGGTTGVTRRWKYTITNEGWLPREYLTPNTVKLQQDVDAGIREIPGCKIELKSGGRL